MPCLLGLKDGTSALCDGIVKSQRRKKRHQMGGRLRQGGSHDDGNMRMGKKRGRIASMGARVGNR
jgi:hypothetical protein